MNQEELKILESGDFEKIKSTLQTFNEKYAKLFDFGEFSAGQWSMIWNSVFNILRERKNDGITTECLSCIRILSREKVYLNSNIQVKDFDCLLEIANLCPSKLNTGQLNSSDVAVEALKCLCNMVFQSLKCQDMCSKNSAVDGILKRVNSTETFPYEIDFFDMKLLFLITALNVKTRTRVRVDLNGLPYLSEWLDIKIKENDHSEQQIDLICEILKVLFNITVIDSEDSSEHEIQYRRITSIIRSLLLDYSLVRGDKQSDLISNATNLLTNVPTSSISELLVGPSTAQQSTKTDIPIKLYEGKCVLAIDVLLEYFRSRLHSADKSPGQQEFLPPILTVFIKCVRSHVTLRHYLRSVILPPLKDVKKRPEEGNELRNYLCRFLTSSQIQIRDLTAELLFVCCKENVARMVKHTGFGNAAGLLANRGLLGGRSSATADYSSDSEDSDTEEYKKMQHGINPVIGCYEPPKSNPFEGMSDEQKEHEALKLVNLMDQLHRQGIIQPCQIGVDGRPQPIEHILQLQEELPQQQIDYKKKT